MTALIETQPEYELREQRELYAHLSEINSAPVYERREAYEAFLDTCQTDPDLVAQRVSWALLGAYGYGAYIASRRMIDSMKNPKPALFYLIASLEWITGNYYAAKCWHSLTQPQQDAVNEAIGREVELCKAEMIAERNPLGKVAKGEAL